MKIANPIYDGAFKFLMEDLTVARRFISILLNREIEVDSFKPQEIPLSDVNKDSGFSAQRLDFIAIIVEPNGMRRKVLIELQKGRNKADAGRFRRYLASNYSKSDIVNGEALDLEIISIYILGFSLDNMPVAVVKTSTKLIDASTQQELNVTTDDETFIRQLHHESIFIDTTKLSDKMQTKVDKLLAIFNQKFKDDKKYTMTIPNDIACVLDDDIFLKRLESALEDADTLFKLNEQIKYQEELNKQREKDIQQASQKAAKHAKYENTIEIAKSMKLEGDAIEKISRITGLTQEQIEIL
ncbi:MAG: hypothetical protein RLZZ210_495 [Pseudomonadota bacterium]|jgi:predicted transposase/invertase (TIGR01784 family)